MDKIKPLCKLNGIDIYEGVVYKVQPFKMKDQNSVLDNTMHVDTTGLITSIEFFKIHNVIRIHSYPDKNRECYHPKLKEFEDKIKITGIDENRSLKREHILLKRIDDVKSELETFKQSLELARNKCLKNVAN